MKTFLKDFGNSLRLTPEESKVIVAISQGAANTSDLEKNPTLQGIDLNSILPSIFFKCSVSSIGQLMAQMLNFSVSRQHTCMEFHRRPNVLVIDDEPEICDLISGELEVRGVRCFTFTDPVKALQEFQYLKIDVIVMDFRMPTMNGLDLIQKMRLTYKFLPPVVVVSGDFSKKHLFDLYELGVFGFIQKPFREDKIFHTVMQAYYDPPRTHELFPRRENVQLLHIPNSTETDSPQIGRGGIQLSATFLSNRLGIQAPFLPEGSSIELGIELPNSGTVFRSFGEVAWRLPDLGLAIKFTQTSEFDLNLLHDYITKNQVSSYIPKPRGELSA